MYKMLHQNKMLILSVVLLALIGIVAGRYWQAKGNVKAAQASDIYQQMVMAYYKPDVEALNAKGQQLIADFKGTQYYQAAALLLAKQAVSDNKPDIAENYLRLASTEKRSANLMFDISTVRLAHVMRERGDIEGALKLLEVAHGTEAGPYEALYQEAIGDLYVAKGDKTQAKAAYKLALESLPEGVQAPLIQMKLIDLGIGEDDAS